MDNTIINSPIFLHFLNRELRETENVQYSDEQLYNLLIVSLFMTSEYIYIGDAIVWEDYAVFPKTINLLKIMEKYGLAFFVGTDIKVESFLEKRRRLYSHDKKRYPVYFMDKIAEPLWGMHHKRIDSDTTAILAKKLFDIANGFTDQQNYPFTNRDRDIIADRLEYRRKNNIAVTYSLFRSRRISAQSGLGLRRNIIINYNQRYLDALNGKIVTGIRGIEYYDSFQNSGLLYDFNLYYYLLSKLGIVNQRDVFQESYEHKIFTLRLSEYEIYRELVFEIKKIANGLYYMDTNGLNHVDFLNRNISKLSDSLLAREKLFSLCRFASLLCMENNIFKEGYEKMSDTSRRILVIAASPLEYKILRRVAKEFGFDFEDKQLEKNENFSYAECYSTLDSKVFLARTDMGALNASVSIGQLVDRLNTTYIIMGGICAGMRPDEQHIGDVIIASKMHEYDLSKKTDYKRISRGNTLNPNRYLYDNFLLESYETETMAIDTGLFISSNTLANSQNYMDEVLLEYPDAKGYEMEGAGLMHICQLLMDKWILVKAICDWGYDKTDSDQEMAAYNSYRFIFNTIKRRIG